MSLAKALQAAAGNAGEALYSDSVFSTYLYTGNGSTQTITNGIDLAGEGGLVWIKARNNTTNHLLADTDTGITKRLQSNLTNAQDDGAGVWISSANADGFSLGVGTQVNGSYNYASWTFRKAAKFFDVVTYTGDNSSGRSVAHNLGSAPGFIAIKDLTATSNWMCYHRSLGANSWIELQSTQAKQDYPNLWDNTNASTFDAASVLSNNTSGHSYVAYLFAHDAGGFGADGSENVISCGSFTTDGSGNATVNLGYEPQWLVIKNISIAEDWYVNDIMRGLPIPAANKYLIPNTSAAEGSGSAIAPTSTGFSTTGLSSSKTYIYVAIRRPMKPPTVGTEVFKPSIGNNVSGSGLIANAGFPVDLHLESFSDGSLSTLAFDRLRGANQYVQTSSTAAETAGAGRSLDNMQGWFYTGTYNFSTAACIYDFKRATGFMDVVCWTGDQGSSTNQVIKNVSHNLGVAPELIITKARNSIINWFVYHKNLTSGYFLRLNLTGNETTSAQDGPFPSSATYTSTTFGTAGINNYSPYNYVAYLFATYPGVSKVGNYTGTGTTQQINCGFTSGARFVLIKRTDSTGDWYVWDSARGIVAGNDPYLLLNSNAAQVTNTDYIDTYSAGFEISSTAPAAINANGGSFIYLAIA